MRTLPPTARSLFKRYGPACPFIDKEVESLDDFLSLVYQETGSANPYWYRGHANLRWPLTPAALRYLRKAKRIAALNCFRDFRQQAHGAMQRALGASDLIEWMQCAQHYGLPTRLLDWTKNASTALYFACEDPSCDGLVFVISPHSLNQKQLPTLPRPICPHDHPEIVEPYAQLGPSRHPDGLGTIAIDPVWTTTRILAQEGTFTLHGERHFALDAEQAPLLSYVPIRRKHKRRIGETLDRVGIHEMKLFPEADKIARYLRRRAQL